MSILKPPTATLGVAASLNSTTSKAFVPPGSTLESWAMRTREADAGEAEARSSTAASTPRRRDAGREVGAAGVVIAMGVDWLLVEGRGVIASGWGRRAPAGGPRGAGRPGGGLAQGVLGRT